MVEVMMECISCGEKVVVGTHNIKQSWVVRSDTGEHVRMTYFDCPHCSERNFVQGDDAETIKLVEAEAKLMLAAMKQKRFGKTLHKKQSEKRKQIEKDLAYSRKLLMDSLVGQCIIDCESKESYTVSFNALQ